VNIDGEFKKALLELGTETIFGRVEGIYWREGERYYFIIDDNGCVSLMPSHTIEKVNNGSV